MKELLKTLDNFRGAMQLNEVLELIYVCKAWNQLSKDRKIEDELKFDTFYNQKVEVKKLVSVFEKLSKQIKLFELYKLDTKNIQDNILVGILNLVNNSLKLPNVNDAFFFEKGKIGDYSVSNQIAELGVKLLDENSKEIYVPFTNGFAYSNYTNKKIFADNQFFRTSLIAELINILEDKEIVFERTNALEEPKFINPDAPHLLKEFKSILSFPPFSVKGNLEIKNDRFNRFNFQRGFVLDVAHFEHILAQTKNKAVVLMAVGFTYRSGSEEEFRKYLIEKNYLESIIQLPPNLHSATSIETTFFVINKNKTEDKVHFINLKDESFIKRDGRQLVFKSLDYIIDIYENKKEIENISCLISNDEIAQNNYSFAIDRYVVAEDFKKMQKTLERFDLIELEKIADIRRSQLFKDEGEGLEVLEISPSDFSKAGFTLECEKIKYIGSQEKRLDTYELQPYDVLLSTKGTIGKVAIIGEITKPMIASQAIQVIRIKGKDKEQKAIALYMFLKSDLGQTILSSLIVGVAMPQISTLEIKKLNVPNLNKDEEKKLSLNFNNELEMYNKITNLEQNIKQLHNEFLRN
ncbi:N-6 DNA methylase [Aliarcobacter cryaerophilus]|uniref:N-6 DNA methylase n=1 Tax=Aliarcobacter cryaerophilus TaxID=28198 RepID=UPI0021B66D08|nr:N-6 DNA methylase [Aliarcobacter cryaerophilus]MCT7486188.1 N-6 DNA methylase [Aliarcobacter cryaerophilus]MCT7490251.1 N-6 DNA methylase [Aliarcobacter cryaerophilus]